MASSATEIESELKDVGNKLLKHTSSIVELLSLLDKAEKILFRVDQAPSRSVQDAMLPVMKALIRTELIAHTEVDVKASVTSCLHEIMRITAPEAPYDDKMMEEIFKLSVMLFTKLSLDAGHCYSKAVSVLDNMANVKSCLVMLDIELDELIVEMFQLFFKIISPHHPVSVFVAMETILTLVLDEIEEVPFELLTPLLSSIRKENQDVSPLSYKLGENVFKKCATRLKPYLSEGLRLSSTDMNDYAEIVSLTCQNGSGMDLVMEPVKESGSDATGYRDDSLFMNGSSKSAKNNCSARTRDLRSKGHLSKSVSLTENGEDKSASQSQNHNFVEGSSRRRGRPKKNKYEIILGGDASIESGGKKKVSFSAKRFQNEDESRFYEGVIYSYNPVEKKHRVLYADGEEELLDLGTEIWEFVEESNFPDEEKDDASGDRDERKDEELKVDSKSKTTTKSIDMSKHDDETNHIVTGSSDRGKNRKKKPKNTNSEGEVIKVG